MKRFLSLSAMAGVMLSAVTATAAIIDFTGGTAYLHDGSSFATTGGYELYQGVDYYVENGFKVDFITGSSNPFESVIGDYYGGENDVIHGHWATGNYGELQGIKISKVDGTAFDLNYFILTSNTATGGSAASGNELTYIHGSNDGSSITSTNLLPPDDWGFSGNNPQIFLGSDFDDIFWFSFSVANQVDCFGMDNFYIDEPAPSVPEPSTFLLLGGGLAGLAFWRRKQSA